MRKHCIKSMPTYNAYVSYLGICKCLHVLFTDSRLKAIFVHFINNIYFVNKVVFVNRVAKRQESLR